MKATMSSSKRKLFLWLCSTKRKMVRLFKCQILIQSTLYSSYPFKTVLTSFVVFDINENAISYLRAIKGSIGVVAVAGMYRTGKSYLLNRMILNRQSGFGVGPTINPCTKVRFELLQGTMDMEKASSRVHRRWREHQRLGHRLRRSGSIR